MKIPAGALVGLPVGVAVGLGVVVRVVGVEARKNRDVGLLCLCRFKSLFPCA